MAKQPSPEALEVLKNCTVEGKHVKLPPEQLPRELYSEVSDLLNKIGGHWKGRTINAFVFDHDPTDLLKEQAEGGNRNIIKEFQFFPTPVEVAGFMMTHLPVVPGIENLKILEPSAGKGALVTAIREYTGKDLLIDCYELLQVNKDVLKEVPGVNLIGDDFLECDKANHYDIIIANPPFSKFQDIMHIRKMYEVLKPGGTIVTLSSPSWTITQAKAHIAFREWLQSLDVVSKPLEAKSFTASGTEVIPVLLVIEKPLVSTPAIEPPVEPSVSIPEEVPGTTKSAKKGKPVSQQYSIPMPGEHKISINNGHLIKALKKAKEVVEKSKNMPVLENLLLKVKGNEATFIATDLSLTLVMEMECFNSYQTSFEVLLPFEFLFHVSGVLNSAELIIEYNLLAVVISGYNDTYHINSLNEVDTFPAVPEFPNNKMIQVGSDFIPWLVRSLDTVSGDTLRPAMTCVCVNVFTEDMRMASTDAHMLMEKSFEIDSNAHTQLLITTKTAKAIKGFKELSIFWSDTHVAYKSDKIALIATRIDAKFPSYETLIRKPVVNIEFNRNELIGTLEKVSLAGDVAIFYLKKEEGTIHIEAVSLEYNRRVNVTIEAWYTGECDSISLSPNNFLKLLYQVEYERICVEISNPMKPVFLSSPADDTYTSLLMPLSIS